MQSQSNDRIGREVDSLASMRAQHNAVNSTFRHVGYLRLCYRLGKSGRESGQGQSIILLSKVSTHILGPRQPPAPWVLGFIPEG